jgi:hypothetical protein
VNPFYDFIRDRQYLLDVSHNTIRWYRHAFKCLPPELPTPEELNATVLRMRESGVRPTRCKAASAPVEAKNTALYLKCPIVRPCPSDHNRLTPPVKTQPSRFEGERHERPHSITTNNPSLLTRRDDQHVFSHGSRTKLSVGFS